MEKKIELFNTKMEINKEEIKKLKEFECSEDLGVEVASFGDAGDLFAGFLDERTLVLWMNTTTKYCYDYNNNIEECIKEFIKDYNSDPEYSDPETGWVLDAYYLRVTLKTDRCTYSFIEPIDEELYNCLKEG